MSLLGGDHPTTTRAPASRPPVSRPPEPAARPARAPREPSRWTSGGHVPGEAGIWFFIVGDMLVFGLFFGVFMVTRGQDLEAFRAGRETLDTTFGALNTLLLLTGSILVVLAMRALRDGAPDRAPRLILGAMLTGLWFIVNKGLEYSDKLSADLTPATNDFYTLFFVFTGIHLLHLLGGMGALTYMYRLARRPARSARDIAMIECAASYWHLVDLLWVVLFPLFYLVA